MHRTTPRLLLLFALPLLISACGASSGDDDAAPSSESTPHGYIAGAQENAEPQTGLLTFDSKTGEAQLLSLLTEDAVDAGTFGPIDAVQRDGRYVFITTQDGMEVFDTGAWTVNHGDHKHYYSAEPGLIGGIELSDAGAVAGDGQYVAVFSETDGYASVYSHMDLDAGEITEAARITTAPHQGRVIPYEDHFITSIAGNDGSAPVGVEVRDSADQPVLAQESCPGLSAHAATRVGVVLACADGALLITEDDGAFAAEEIPYPADAAGVPPATTLEHRPGSNELAALAGNAGIWHLDVSERTWRHHETPVPVIGAAAVGDTKRVLALGIDGSFLTIDSTSGEVTDRTEVLEAPVESGETPEIRVDPSRAYVSDPSGSTVHELDYRDGLRIARTFDVPSADLMLETGL